jgi:hypothetical protein
VSSTPWSGSPRRAFLPGLLETGGLSVGAPAISAFQTGKLGRYPFFTLASDVSNTGICQQELFQKYALKILRTFQLINYNSISVLEMEMQSSNDFHSYLTSHLVHPTL